MWWWWLTGVGWRSLNLWCDVVPGGWVVGSLRDGRARYKHTRRGAEAEGKQWEEYGGRIPSRLASLPLLLGFEQQFPVLTLHCVDRQDCYDASYAVSWI